MAIPVDFVATWEYLPPEVIFETISSKTRPKSGQIWVVKNEIRPADLYCYFGARFGPPNGFQNFLRRDDSDNFIHWDWTFKTRLLLDSRGLDLKAWYNDDPFFKSMIGVELMQVNIKNLSAEAQCYDSVRELRWPAGRQCPFCDAKRVIKRGFDENEPARQRYECNVCGKRFDDLTGTICAGHHQPLKVWMLCLYFMGLNWSNEPMAKELDLDHSDVHQMTTELRAGVVKKSLT